MSNLKSTLAQQYCQTKTDRKSTNLIASKYITLGHCRAVLVCLLHWSHWIKQYIVSIFISDSKNGLSATWSNRPYFCRLLLPKYSSHRYAQLPRNFHRGILPITRQTMHSSPCPWMSSILPALVCKMRHIQWKSTVMRDQRTLFGHVLRIDASCCDFWNSIGHPSSISSNCLCRKHKFSKHSDTSQS